MSNRCLPVYLSEDEYAQLASIAKAEDRHPLQQARRIVRQAIVMPAQQRAAWDALWRDLLTDNATTEQAPDDELPDRAA